MFRDWPSPLVISRVTRLTTSWTVFSGSGAGASFSGIRFTFFFSLRCFLGMRATRISSQLLSGFDVPPGPCPTRLIGFGMVGPPTAQAPVAHEVLGVLNYRVSPGQDGIVRGFVAGIIQCLKQGCQ